MSKQIEALKLALEALECALSDDRPYIVQCKEAITAIEEALAQPEQDGKCKYCTDGCPACDARKLPEQEPFMASYEFKQYGYYKDGKGTLKLGNIPATQPPQRTWVGLTDDEYAKLAEEFGPFPINQIEAKLKEKNT